jgi:hypothetical protein
MPALAAYLASALADEALLAHHLAWKRASPNSWAAPFRDLVANQKGAAFCAACDAAAAKATAHASAAVNKSPRGEARAASAAAGFVEEEEAAAAAEAVAFLSVAGAFWPPRTSVLSAEAAALALGPGAFTTVGHLKLIVAIDGRAAREVDVAVPSGGDIEAYAAAVAAWVGADGPGALAIEAEIRRIQDEDKLKRTEGP